MEKTTIQQEILLVTTNTFSQRQFCDKDAPNGNQSLSNTQMLEEACWNGMLKEMLPDVLAKTFSGKDLFLWHVRKGQSFLQIELSEFPLKVDKHYSIDTTFFLSKTLCN